MGFHWGEYSSNQSDLFAVTKKLFSQGNTSAIFTHFDDRLKPANQHGGLFCGKNIRTIHYRIDDMPRGLPGISTGMVPEPKAQLNRFTPRSESDVRKAYTSEWHEKLQSRSHAQTSLILACWSWPVPTCFSNYSKVIVDQLPVAYGYVNATQLYLSLRGCSGCNAVLH